MITFKDQVAADRLGVFISMDEFAEEHEVDGNIITCVLDSDEYSQRSPEVGIESADLRLHAQSEDLTRKTAGDMLEVDGTIYIIVSWQENMGIAQVELSAAQSAF